MDLPDYNVTMERLEKIVSIHKKNEQDFLDWLRWLITIATGAIALLIPLTSTDVLTGWTAWLFRAALIFIGIGILSLLIHIHATIKLGQKMVSEMWKRLEEKKPMPIISMVMPNYALVSVRIGYISLCTGLTLLIAFACFPRNVTSTSMRMNFQQHTSEASDYQPRQPSTTTIISRIHQVTDPKPRKEQTNEETTKTNPTQQMPEGSSCLAKGLR